MARATSVDFDAETRMSTDRFFLFSSLLIFRFSGEEKEDDDDDDDDGGCNTSDSFFYLPEQLVENKGNVGGTRQTFF